MFYWVLETSEIFCISTLWTTFSLPFLVGKTFAWDSGICKVSEVCDYLTVSMSQYVAVCQKKCHLTIKLLVIESENQFLSRNEGFKINIVYPLCNLNLQHYKVTLLLYPVFTQALCQEFKTQVHHQKH